jgi:hypothetical protein
MAITAAPAGTANSTTSSATLAVTTTATVALGEFIVVAIGADNNGGGGASSTTGVTDSAGNTYVLRADQLRDPGAAEAGTSLRVYCATAQYALASGQTVTVSFSPNTVCKAAAVWRVVPTSTATHQISFLAETGTSGNGANPTITSATVTSGDLVIGVNSAETSTTPTADADTSNGTWSTAQVGVANSGSGVTSAVVTTQYKVVTGTATQTYNTTLVALDNAISILTFTELRRPVGDPRIFAQALTTARLFRHFRPPLTQVAPAQLTTAEAEAAPLSVGTVGSRQARQRHHAHRRVAAPHLARPELIPLTVAPLVAAALGARQAIQRVRLGRGVAFPHLARPELTPEPPAAGPPLPMRIVM